MLFGNSNYCRQSNHMRTFTPAYQAKLNEINTDWTFLVELFTAPKSYFTLSGSRLTYEGNNYLVNNSIMDVDKVTISSELSQTPFTIKLANSDNAWDSILEHGLEVRVHHVFIEENAEGVEVAVAGALWDRGYFKKVSDDLRGDKVAKAIFVNRLAKFDIVNDARTTKNSIQQDNMTDSSFNRSDYDEVQIQIGPKS